MSEKKKGSCLGAILKFILVIIILFVVLIAVGYFTIKSPTGSAGKFVETVMSPFVSKDIKTLMDSTEEFLDEYIKLTEAVATNNNAELMAEMDDYMEKYQQAMTDLNAIDKNTLGIFSQFYVNLRLTRMSAKALIAQQAMLK